MSCVVAALALSSCGGGGDTATNAEEVTVTTEDVASDVEATEEATTDSTATEEAPADSTAAEETASTEEANSAE